MAGKSATDVDKRIGERITAFRMNAGLNQREVAQALGVTASQLQKYETGVNCLKANAIPVLVALFERNIGDFFDHDESAASPAPASVPANFPDTVLALVKTADRIEQAVTTLKCALATVTSAGEQGKDA